jgi:hypothetical protein
VAIWLRGPVAAAGRPTATLAVAASSKQVPCTWRLVTRADFDAPDAGLRARNGEFGKQALVTHEGRGAWRQGSDWNQLFVPAGARRPDVFAVQASFFAPVVAGQGVGVGLHVYGDPDGSMDQRSSDLRHGRGISLVEEPTRAVRYAWGVAEGVNTTQVSSKGTLPGSISGRWRSLRFEGSRSGCWIRVLLDGVPLLFEAGACDFAGGDVMLSGHTNAAYLAADVLWREFSVWEGEASCQ